MGDSATTAERESTSPEDRLEGLQLVQRVAGGDGQAVDELYDRYAPSLLAQIVSMIGDRAEAEDVLQEVFVQAWRQASRYDHRRASVLTWLSMVARTRAIDRYRGGRSRQRAYERAAHFDVTVDAAPPEGMQRIWLEEMRSLLGCELARIPSEQREVLGLLYVTGLSHTQAANRLRLPLGTVKTRALLGMRKLRQAFAAQLGSPA